MEQIYAVAVFLAYIADLVQSLGPKSSQEEAEHEHD